MVRQTLSVIKRYYPENEFYEALGNTAPGSYNSFVEWCLKHQEYPVSEMFEGWMKEEKR